MQDLHSENHTTGPAVRGNAPHLPAAPLPEKARLQGSIIIGGEAPTTSGQRIANSLISSIWHLFSTDVQTFPHCDDFDFQV